MIELKEAAKRFLEKVSEVARDNKKLGELEEAARKFLEELAKVIPIIRFRVGGLEKMAKLLAKKALAEAKDEKNQQEALGMAGAAAAPAGVLAAVTAIAGSNLTGGAAMAAGLSVVGFSVMGVALPAAGLTIAGYFGGKYAARQLQKARKRRAADSKVPDSADPEASDAATEAHEKAHRLGWMGWIAGICAFGVAVVVSSWRALLQRQARAGEDLGKKARQALYEEQGGICNGCKRDFPIDILEADHIIPKSRGGSHAIEN